MNHSLEHDRVILDHIVEAIDAYSGPASLEPLIGNVEAGIEALSDSTLSEALRDPWSELEVIHAVALSENRAITAEDGAALAAALARLRSVAARENAG